MPVTDPSVKYYLRNAYTQNYLTVSSASIVPASKIEDDWHQWTFPVGGPTGSNYLYNVGSGQYFYIGTYSDNYNGWARVFLGTTPYAFVVSQDAGGLFSISATTANHTVYIHDEGGIYAVTSNYNYAGYDQVARRQWYLEPAGAAPGPQPISLLNKNPLPKGVYRIRSFNAKYVLTMPKTAGNGSPFVTKQVPKDDYQKWTVTPQTNGLYTIANAGNSAYLAAPPQNLTAGTPLLAQSVRGGEDPFQWNVQTFGPGLFFFIGLRETPLSIGFADYDEAEDLEAVVLEPSDNIPSQIWFFETFKLLEPTTFHGKRVLDAGDYTIESCENNAYLLVPSSGDLTTTTGRAQATTFTIKYADDTSPNFTLSYYDAYGTSYLLKNGDRLDSTDAQKRATLWVAIPLERDDQGSAYHICEVGSNEPRRAISARQITDRNKSYFAIDPLAEQEVMQMWRFHS